VLLGDTLIDSAQGLAEGLQDGAFAVIFIGAIGGFIAFGIIGPFVGAVVLVLGYTLFLTWLVETPHRQTSPTAVESAPVKDAG
jgi:hypothetical protein